jgi:hypothetical protein
LFWDGVSWSGKYLPGSGFKPKSSWSLLPENLGLQAWGTCTQLVCLSRQTFYYLSHFTSPWSVFLVWDFP